MAAFVGTSGSDTLNGGSGDDEFRFSSGQDTISGGDGYDIIRASGPQQDYTITSTENGIELSNGTDTTLLTGIEKIEFDQPKEVFNLTFDDDADAAIGKLDGPHWVVDRSPVDNFEIHKNGDNRLEVNIKEDGSQNDFYHYQGMKYLADGDTGSSSWGAGDGSTLSYDFYIDPNWVGDKDTDENAIAQRTGIWGVMENDDGDITAYPCFEYVDADAGKGGDESKQAEAGFRAFFAQSADDTVGSWQWIGIPEGIDPDGDGWVTVQLTFEEGVGYHWSIDGVEGFTDPGPTWDGSTGLKTFILNSSNTGDDTSYLYDNIVLTDGEGEKSNTLVVDADSEYATIQSAIDAAEDGDTILVQKGTYTENVVINKDITLAGAEDGVVIEGTFHEDNDIAPDDSLEEFFAETKSYAGTSGAGITVQASGATIQNVEIHDFYTGIELANGASDLLIQDVDISAVGNGIRKGTEATIDNVDIVGGSISDGHIGIYFAKTTDPTKTDIGTATDVTIDQVDFSHLSEKGIYVEALSDSAITNITMDHVGVLGRGPAFDGNPSHLGGFGTGIDINLKNGTYSDIKISDFKFTDVGTSEGTSGTDYHEFGAAISIKARDDGSYGPAPARYEGEVVIENGSIDGTSTGIRAGEPGKEIGGPALKVTNVEITDFANDGVHGTIDNVTQETLLMRGTAGADVIVAAPTTKGQVSIDGGAGADTLGGGAEEDTLSGGAGGDVFFGSRITLDGDIITDFGAGDLLVLDGASSGTKVTYNGDELVIVDGADTVTIDVQDNLPGAFRTNTDGEIYYVAPTGGGGDGGDIGGGTTGGEEDDTLAGTDDADTMSGGGGN
ncbi:hypothetical protein J2R99_003571, partial [Rhodopseudomonas julia]|nr:hypothetical protein [Rhodopseudomonas julia]